MIYNVITRRMQVWKHRIEAGSPEEAKTFGDELSENEPAQDDYGYDTEAHVSKDQTTEADNA